MPPEILSEQTRILNKITSVEQLMLPQNRPQVEVLEVAAVGTTVTVGDQLRNGQLLGIAGETAAGAAVFGNTLWAEISSISNATFAERVAIESSIKQGFGLLSAAQLIIFIIQSQTLAIELTGGATSTKLHFWYLPPSYLIQQ